MGSDWLCGRGSQGRRRAIGLNGRLQQVSGPAGPLPPCTRLPLGLDGRDVSLNHRMTRSLRYYSNIISIISTFTTFLCAFPSMPGVFCFWGSSTGGNVGQSSDCTASSVTDHKLDILPLHNTLEITGVTSIPIT